MTTSIGRPTRHRHAQFAPNEPDFGISATRTVTWVGVQWRRAVTLRRTSRSRTARVSPRSHRSCTRQPRSRPLPPDPLHRGSWVLRTARETRGRAISCQARTQTRSAALRDT